LQAYIIKNRHIKRYVGLNIHATGKRGYKFCVEFLFSKDESTLTGPTFTTELTA